MAMSETSEIVEVNVNKAAWLEYPENYKTLTSHQSFTGNTVKKLWSIFLNSILCCGTMSVTSLHFFSFC